MRSFSTLSAVLLSLVIYTCMADSDCDVVISMWSDMGGNPIQIPRDVDYTVYDTIQKSFDDSYYYRYKYGRYYYRYDYDGFFYRPHDMALSEAKAKLDTLQVKRCCSMHGVTCDLSSVIGIDWNSSGLKRSIPSQVGNLMALRSLDLSSNELSGFIPQQIGNLGQLESLSLSNNELRGSIPSQVGNLMALRSLDLSSNKLSGFIPQQIGNLGQLESLSLSNNELIGTIPPDFGQLLLLQSLNNRLSGPLPSSLKKMQRLQVSLDGNNFDQALPNGTYHISEIAEILDSTDCYWVGRLVQSFSYIAPFSPYHRSGCCEMRGVTCEDGLVTEIILDNWDMHNKAIPVLIGNLEHLRVLSIENAKIGGVIPREIGNLFKLEVLKLGRNQITGVPKEIGRLHNLVSLDLRENRIRSLPDEIGNLENLRYLAINNNHRVFQRVIPSFLARLRLDELCISGYYGWLGFRVFGGRFQKKVSEITGLKGTYFKSKDGTGNHYYFSKSDDEST